MSKKKPQRKRRPDSQVSDPQLSFDLANKVMESLGWDISDIQTTYLALKTQVVNTIAEAKEKNEKPVFILGDDHQSLKGVLVQLMFIKIVGDELKKTNSLKGSVFLEVGQKELDAMKKQPFPAVMDRAPAIFQLGTLNKTIEESKFNLYPAESDASRRKFQALMQIPPGSLRSRKSMELFEERINDTVDAVKNNKDDMNILLLGGAHCLDTKQRLEEQEGYHVVALMAPTQELPVPAGLHSPEEKKKIAEAKDPQNMPQISLQGKHDITPTLISGAVNGKAFYHGLQGILSQVSKSIGRGGR